MDPFATFDLEPSVHIDTDDLERRYLKLSRDTHPDRHQDLPPEEMATLMQRAADLNRAYRILKDPWQRAAALLELRDPGVMERNKKLDPHFLMEAMEQAEQVAEAPDRQVPSLRQRLSEGVHNYLDAVVAAIDKEDWNRAATLLHQSRYQRKALADLEDKTDD